MGVTEEGMEVQEEALHKKRSRKRLLEQQKMIGLGPLL